MRNEPPVELIVYGDFNCPFSALASVRANHLERLGRATIDWRAVEHAPDIPPAGIPVTGELSAQLRRELDHVHTLLTTDESDELVLPTVQSNTNRATAAYAATPPSQRAAVRARLFAAYWRDGADLADSTTLARLGAGPTDEHTAARWRDEWLAQNEPIVPAMVLPDGYVSRGLGALARLARFGTSVDPADLGGESPCLAHLLDEDRD